MAEINFQDIDESKIIEFNFTELKDGILAINSNHFFTDTTHRDNYFLTNQNELNIGRIISVGGNFQQYNGVQWVDKTLVLTGPPGESGPPPEHKWHDNHPTRLGFKNPDGTWGEFSDIRGPDGPRGVKPSHQWDGSRLRFENPDGSWGTYTTLQGDPGEKGDSGNSFNVDIADVKSNRVNYDSELPGFSFLATDEGKLYFRIGDTTGVWSDPIPFQTEQQLKKMALRYALLFT